MQSLIPLNWNLKKLKDISEIEMGQSPEGQSYNAEGLGVPLINGPSDFGETYPLISQWTTAPTKMCKKDDILLCIRATIGKTNVADREYCIGRGVAAIKNKKRTAERAFLEHLLAFNEKCLLRLSTGSTFLNIDKKTLSEIHFLVPPIEEQEKIDIFLEAWNKAIRKSTSLIIRKVKLKQGLMQQLLAGKMRFKDFSGSVFHKTEIGKFLIPTSRPVARPNNSYTALGIRSHGKGTFLRTVDDPDSVMMDTLYEVKEDDLIVNITFAWEGAIAIVKKSDEGALVSHRFPTYTFNRGIVIPEYFKHIIQTKRFVHELGLVSPGGAGRNRVLSKKDFLNIVVSIPSVDEQKKIAALLNGIDREIELLGKKLEFLINQKKGLMQKLLTGRIRVKV